MRTGTKDRVLELLERHRGESISGERIAGLLGLSRNAVWKAIGELRGDGYSIVAVTNRGYCLSPDNDILSVQGIRPFLWESALPYGEKMRLYDTLDSTNKTAKELAIAGAGHGTVVLSDCQRAGRGRYSRSFFSPPGQGIYLSVILRPEALPFGNMTSVTAFAAVAVCEAIEAVSDQKPQIKWVNDILIDGKKVCGILTEAMTDFESGQLDWIVLGIGLNVTVPREGFPPELRETAVSVFPGGSAPVTRNRLSAEIINRVLGYAPPPDEKEIFAKYKSRLMVLGRKVTVQQGDSAYRATAVDIDGAGHLIVEDEAGRSLTLLSGEVRIQQ